MPDDVVLEAPEKPIAGGMPTGTPPPAAPAGPPAAPVKGAPPPVGDPQGDPDDDPNADPGDDPDADPDAQPRGRRTLVGEMVRERERRQLAEAQLQSSTDLLRQIMTDPQGAALLSRVVGGGAPAPAGPSAEEQAAQQAELETLAIDLGLYDERGAPDLTTAKRIQEREERRVAQVVKRELGAFEQTKLQPLAQQRAQQVIGHVVTVAQQYGIDPQLVQNGMQALYEQNPNAIYDEQAQQAVLMTALGIQTFGAAGAPPTSGQPGAPAPRRPRAPQGGSAPLRPGAPPIYTEPPGGGPRAQSQLAEPFRVRLREAGLKDDEINASLGRFVPGAPNALE